MTAPGASAIVARGMRAAFLAGDGACRVVEARDAAPLVERAAPLVVHLRATARRLAMDPFPAHDLLELHAFVRPARACLPTPAGLARALGIEAPHALEDQARMLPILMDMLLEELSTPALRGDPWAAPIARLMARGGWRWGPMVLDALGADAAPQPGDGEALAVWRRLGEWAETAPEPPAGDMPVEPVEARARLHRLDRHVAGRRLGRGLRPFAEASPDGQRLAVAGLRRRVGAQRVEDHRAPAPAAARHQPRDRRRPWIPAQRRRGEFLEQHVHEDGQHPRLVLERVRGLDAQRAGKAGGRRQAGARRAHEGVELQQVMGGKRVHREASRGGAQVHDERRRALDERRRVARLDDAAGAVAGEEGRAHAARDDGAGAGCRHRRAPSPWSRA